MHIRKRKSNKQRNKCGTISLKDNFNYHFKIDLNVMQTIINVPRLLSSTVILEIITIDKSYDIKYNIKNKLKGCL